MAIDPRRREALADHLRADGTGVEIIISWPKPIWEYPALELGQYTMPVTEALCREVILLPLNSEISDESIDAVIDSIRRFPW